MNFNELILTRQSCRSYDITKPVDKDDLVKMIEAGRLSPSARNSQPWHYHVVINPEYLKEMRKACQLLGFNKFTNEVNSFIVIEEGKTPLLNKVGARDFTSIDIGSTVAYMTLEATNIGLSTCIIGSFHEAKTIEALRLDKSAKIRLVLAVGYAKEDDPIRPKNRKDLAEIAEIIE